MEDTETESKNESAAPGKSETPYPYFGLAHAIAIVEAVRRAGGKDALSADVMREMSIALKTDRKWSYGVPTAALFGLIERVGRGDSGRIKITELGLRVVLPGTPEEAAAAKISAFKQPDLYVKLLERFAGFPIPSKEGLRNLLHREYGIVESMALGAADAFIESLATAGLITTNNLIAANGAATGADDKLKPKESSGEDGAPRPGTKTIHVPQHFRHLQVQDSQAGE